MARRQDRSSIHLTRIYTKTGDSGNTALGDMSRVAKTSARIGAYAAVDETNAAIGVAIAIGQLPEAVVALLRRLQNQLFDLGADLATPVSTSPKYPPLRISEAYVSELEAACDEFNAELAPLTSFVLPGGTPGSALLHVARTVARRAERETWALLEAEPATTSDLPARYLNRLSDLLFILSRVACGDGGEVTWVPGGSQT
ncbi:MAG: cob(I)yrinic acid a,c-diamide adenosyltransferase [Mycobacteriales bacterium]